MTKKISFLLIPVFIATTIGFTKPGNAKNINFPMPKVVCKLRMGKQVSKPLVIKMAERDVLLGDFALNALLEDAICPSDGNPKGKICLGYNLHLSVKHTKSDAKKDETIYIKNRKAVLSPVELTMGETTVKAECKIQ